MIRAIKTLFSFAVAILVCGTFFVGCNPVNTPPQPEPAEEGFLKYMPSMIYWEKIDYQDRSKPIIILNSPSGYGGHIWMSFKYYCDDSNPEAIYSINIIYSHELIDNNRFRLTEEVVNNVPQNSAWGSYYDDWVKLRDQYLSATWIFTSEYKAGDGIYWRLSDEEGKVPDLVFCKDVALGDFQ